MPVTVESIFLMRDGFTAPMDWNADVIGLNVTNINIQVAASGAAIGSMPAAIPVRAESRAPNRSVGAATIAGALSWTVPLYGPAPGAPSRTLYRLTRPIDDAGPFLLAEAGGRREVATVRRSGGTSDEVLRQALGWLPRGIGTQPTARGAATGSPSGDVPDALRLLYAGGVEVLDVAVVPGPGWHVLDPRSKGLIRSPADLFYYTGHGLGTAPDIAGNTNCLAIETASGYLCWADPGDLTPNWRSPMDLDTAVFAACNILRINFAATPPSGPGLRWAELLTTKGGPITALLGYRRKAPLDKRGGNEIAAEFGARVAEFVARGAGGTASFVRAWLEVNASKKQWKAVAMDARGYWWLELPARGSQRSTGYTICGPRAIP